MAESPGSEQRSKRRRIDKHGRFAALERLKNLKTAGTKNKYEVDEIKNVYDEVDESEYAKIVNDRARDDFVEDDDGTGYGYVENGREIFDEDELEEQGPSRNKEKSKKGKKRGREESARVPGRKSLKNFFNKEHESNVKIADDKILADILNEIKSESASDTTTAGANSRKEIKPMQMTPKPKPVDTEEEMRRYMENFSKNIKKTEEVVEENDSDEEMLNRVLKQSSSTNKSKVNQIKKVAAKKQEIPEVKHMPIETITKVEVKTEPPPDETSFSDHSPISISEFMDDDFDLTAAEVESQVTQKQPMDPVKEEITTDSAKLLSGWGNICASELEDDMDASVLEGATPQNSDETIRFWFWDAWTDPAKCQGEIYIFGKAATGKKPNEFQSVCVHVQNVDRCMYLLAREKELDLPSGTETDKEVSMLDVYNEFCDDISSKLGVTKYRTKVVTKNFAYTSGMGELLIPTQSEYLEVRYSAKLSAPAPDGKYRTVSHIFGTNTNIVEQFLLERKVKGPCWMDLKNFKKNTSPASHCKVEYIVPDINCISVAQDASTVAPPPLIACAINFRSILNKGTNEIAMISVLVHDRFPLNKPPPNPPFNRHFCGVARPTGTSWPHDFDPSDPKINTKVTKCENERTLLNWFLSMYGTIDPDLIVTHDAYDFQLDLICQRLMAIKIPQWARIGRLKMKTPSSRRVDDFFVGRMICDVKTSAEELIKSRSYDLKTLCAEVLKIQDGERRDVLLDDIPGMYEKSADLKQLIGLTMQDNFYTMRLMCELNVLPLALQITQIAGNLMNRTLHGGRAERNEFLLLHAFNEKDYIMPDKAPKAGPGFTQEGGEANDRRKPKSKAAYAGGLVLEPIKGFYDKFILLMDFNSLYPSIIQEYNICFTTVLPPADGEDESGAIIVQTDEMGILPRQIRKLVESRKAVKQLMKASGLEPELKMQYNIRQMALKLTANSLYGCLGYTRSRFYAQHLAALITQKGREILMNTKSIVEKMNYQVIYGDTDSIMINTNSTDYEQVSKIGSNIKQFVNKTYKCLELDVDGIYKYLLLLKKKKYAAVTIAKVGEEYKCTQELKGLDIVRRDWSKIAVIAGNFVLHEILSDKPMDERIENIHTKLEKLKDDLMNGTTFPSLLEITKQLTKPLHEYSDASLLPHVAVALRMNKQRNRNFKRGDVVGYIICEDGTSAAAMKRAYHIDELKDPANKDKLKPDVEYYLSQQIFPVVFRICEPLEGTDACRLSVCLGLDPKKFQNLGMKAGDREHADGDAVQKSISQKYRLCHRFDFTCVTCSTKNPVASGFRKDSGKHKSVFEKCANESCTVLPQQYLPAIVNELTLAIRADVKRFYQRWMVCDNPICNQNTRLYSQVATKNNPHCLHCLNGLLVQQYSESDLYLQLNYYNFMFDLSHYDSKITRLLPPDLRNMYTALKAIVDRFLSRSKYATVKLSTLYLNYAINPNSRQPKIYPVKELAATIGTKEKVSLAGSGQIRWEQYLNYD
ncbi:DNA polymerase alpha catalytic subunit [Toxorhynchites rutilus septentrionalis]|uniref:DNA polymerase alpha catalytic subunit n=1 Tax=Toxorhynchites rutilus septentrionalis TaxID=329112 RepID=UPI00247948B3|nr:DNA polymerase alpha catalytic subunit [Toxorhynchites rutilus septentrionalis]